MNKIKSISIRMKLLIGLGLIVITLSVVLVGFGYQYLKSVEDTRLDLANSEKQHLVEVLLDNNKELLSSDLEIISTSEAMKQLFINRDRNGLYNRANAFFANLRLQNNINHLEFIDTDGRVFLHVDDKDRYGDMSSTSLLSDVIKSGSRVSGMELGSEGFILRSIMPYKIGDRLIGYISIGMDIDDIITTISSKTSGEFEAIGSKQYLDKSSWQSMAKTLGIDEDWDSFNLYATISESKANGEIDGCLSKEMNFKVDSRTNYKRFNYQGKELVCNTTPLISAGGETIGELVYAVDITETVNSTSYAVQVRAIISGILSISLWYFSFVYVDRLILRPLKSLKEAVDDITETNDLSKDVPEKSNDEFGSLGKSFNNLKDKLRKSHSEIEYKIKQRTAELEALNSSMVGRELQMIELKKKLADAKGDQDYDKKPKRISIK